jgi:hypothetical protein
MAELLTNGTLDTNFTGWNSGRGNWDAITIDPAGYSGGCAKIDLSVTVGTIQSIYQTPAVPVAGKYIISFMVKTSGAADAPFYTDIRGLDASDSTVCYADSIQCRNVGATGDWTQITAYMYNRSTAISKIYFKLGGGIGTSGGYVWLDSVSLSADPTVVPFYDLVKPNYKAIIHSDEDKEVKVGFYLFPTTDTPLSAIVVNSRIENSSHVTQVTRDATTYATSGYKTILHDASSLAAGTYHVNLSIGTAANSALFLNKDYDFTISASSTKPSVYFDEYKRCVVDGNLFFPLIAWTQAPHLPDEASNINKIIAAKFNTLMYYSWLRDTEALQTQYRNYGLKYIAPLYRYTCGPYLAQASNKYKDGVEHAYPNAVASELTTSYVSAVTDNKTMSGLLAWHICEEVGQEYFNQEYYDTLQVAADWVKANDPNHPLWAVHADNVKSLEVSNDFTEVVGYDKYPVHDSTALSGVSTAIARIYDSGLQHKPLWQIIECGQMHVDSGNVPTSAQMMNMCFQALIAGARGLAFYPYHYQIGTVRQSSIDRVATAMNSLTHVALGLDASTQVTVDTLDVSALTRIGTNGQKYILLANLGAADKTVTFTSSSLNGYNIKKGLPSDVPTYLGQVTTGTFTDTITGYGYQLYEMIPKNFVTNTDALSAIRGNSFPWYLTGSSTTPVATGYVTSALDHNGVFKQMVELRKDSTATGGLDLTHIVTDIPYGSQIELSYWIKPSLNVGTSWAFYYISPWLGETGGSQASQLVNTPNVTGTGDWQQVKWSSYFYYDVIAGSATGLSGCYLSVPLSNERSTDVANFVDEVPTIVAPKHYFKIRLNQSTVGSALIDDVQLRVTDPQGGQLLPGDPVFLCSLPYNNRIYTDEPSSLYTRNFIQSNTVNPTALGLALLLKNVNTSTVISSATTSIANGLNYIDIELPMTGISASSYILDTYIYNVADSSIVSSYDGTEKRYTRNIEYKTQPREKVSIDRYGRFLKSGTPYFPIVQWVSTDVGNFPLVNRVSMLQTLKDSGFTAIHDYFSRYGSANTGEGLTGLRTRLDECATVGLDYLWCLNAASPSSIFVAPANMQYSFTDPTCGISWTTPDMVASGMVDTFKSHPAMLGWMIFEEPESTDEVAFCKDRYAKIKSWDKENIVFIDHCYRERTSDRNFMDMDAAGFTAYPYYYYYSSYAHYETSGYIPHFTRTYLDHQARTNWLLNKPNLSVLECYEAPLNLRSKDYIFEAYMALITGARGIDWFRYSYLSEKQRLELHKAATAVSKATNAVIGLTSTTQVSANASDVKVLTRTYNGKNYILAANGNTSSIIWGHFEAGTGVYDCTHPHGLTTGDTIQFNRGLNGATKVYGDSPATTGWIDSEVVYTIDTTPSPSTFTVTSATGSTVWPNTKAYLPVEKIKVGTRTTTSNVTFNLQGLPAHTIRVWYGSLDDTYNGMDFSIRTLFTSAGYFTDTIRDLSARSYELVPPNDLTGNLLVNPGFETGTLSGWTNYTAARTAIVNTEYNSGSFSMCLTKATADGSTYAQNRVYGIQPNYRYKLTTYVKVIDTIASPASANTGYIAMSPIQFDSASQGFSSINSAYYNCTDPNLPNNTWYELTVITQPTHENIDSIGYRVGLYGDFSGTVYFDDCKLEEYYIPEYNFKITHPDTLECWYQGDANNITVTGKLTAAANSVALSTLESYATLYSPTDTIIETSTIMDVPDTGDVSHSFTTFNAATTGEYTVTTIVRDKATSAVVITKDLSVIVKPAGSTLPSIYFDDKGRTIDNGTTIFPLIGYTSYASLASPSYGTSYSGKYLQDFDINYVIPMVYNLYIPTDSTSIQINFELYLESLDSIGLKAFLPIYPFTYGSLSWRAALSRIPAATTTLSAITIAVSAFKDNPALCGYTLTDDKYDSASEELTRNHDTIKALDTIKPIIDPQSGDHADFVDRINVGDISGNYQYPISSKNRSGLDIYDSYLDAYNTYKRFSDKVVAAKPAWHVIESCELVDGYTLHLTYDHMLLNAFLAIIGGARGLTFYAVGFHTEAAATVYNRNPNTATDLINLISKIRELEPILISDYATNPVTTSNADIVMRTFDYNGVPVCLAANYTSSTQEHTITIPQDYVTSVTVDNVRGTTTTVPVVTGTITDTLSSFEVRKYTLLPNEAVLDYDLQDAGPSITDYSGFDNTGTAYNTSRIDGPTTDYIYSFNGSSSYISAGNGVSLQAWSSFSIETWAFIPSADSVRQLAMKGTGTGATNDGWYFYTTASAGSTYVGLTVFDAARSGKAKSVIVTPDNWYHLVGTFNGSGIDYYVNGVKAGSTVACTGHSPANSQNLIIGRASNTTASYFNSYLGRVRLYNSALAGSEITTLYNSSKALYDILTLTTIEDKTVDELATLSFTASAVGGVTPYTFSAIGAPSGATLNSSGEFSWEPTEVQGPGSYSFTVRVVDTSSITEEGEGSNPVLNIGFAALTNYAPTNIRADLNNVVNGDEFTQWVASPAYMTSLGALTLSAATAEKIMFMRNTNGLWYVLEDPAISKSGQYMQTVPINITLNTWNGTTFDSLAAAQAYYDSIFLPDTPEWGSDTQIVNIVVNEVNQAPVLASIGNKTVNELEQLSFTATATDDDIPANTLTFSLSGEPTGASIVPTGAFTWTPTEEQGPGVYNFNVIVTDNGVPPLSDMETITVSVSAVNIAPVLGLIGNKTVNEGSALSFTATATDANLPPDILTFSLSGAPSGTSIGVDTGIFSWTPTEVQGPGSYTFNVVVADNGVPPLSAMETIIVTVGDVNTPPTLSPIISKTVAEGATLTFTAVATDADVPVQTLTYSLTDAPSGATIDPSTGGFSWAPTEVQGPGTYYIIVRATDNGTPPLYAERTVTIVVTEVNTAPVIADVPESALIYRDSEYTFTATATDADVPAQTLTFSLVNAPTGASITTGGVFTWTPTESQEGLTYVITVVVSDGALTDSADISIEVGTLFVNTPPVITVDPILTGNERTLMSMQITATDEDIPAQTLTFSLSGQPSGCVIDPSTGLITWTPTEAQGAGTYTFNVIVTDSYGATDMRATHWIVGEVAAPPVLTYIPNKTINELAQLSFTATAADPDIPVNTLTFTLSGAPSGAVMTTGGSFTWTPTEEQGPGVYNFNVVVSDGALTDSQLVQVTVLEVGTVATPTVTLPFKSVYQKPFVLSMAAGQPSTPWTASWTYNNTTVTPTGSTSGLTSGLLDTAGAATYPEIYRELQVGKHTFNYSFYGGVKVSKTIFISIPFGGGHKKTLVYTSEEIIPTDLTPEDVLVGSALVVNYIDLELKDTEDKLIDEYVAIDNLKERIISTTTNALVPVPTEYQSIINKHNINISDYLDAISGQDISNNGIIKEIYENYHCDFNNFDSNEGILFLSQLESMQRSLLNTIGYIESDMFSSLYNASSNTSTLSSTISPIVSISKQTANTSVTLRSEIEESLKIAAREIQRCLVRNLLLGTNAGSRSYYDGRTSVEKLLRSLRAMRSALKHYYMIKSIDWKNLANYAKSQIHNMLIDRGLRLSLDAYTKTIAQITDPIDDFFDNFLNRTECGAFDSLMAVLRSSQYDLVSKYRNLIADFGQKQLTYATLQLDQTKKTSQLIYARKYIPLLDAIISEIESALTTGDFELSNIETALQQSNILKHPVAAAALPVDTTDIDAVESIRTPEDATSKLDSELSLVMPPPPEVPANKTPSNVAEVVIENSVTWHPVDSLPRRSAEMLMFGKNPDNIAYEENKLSISELEQELGVTILSDSDM